MYSSFAKYYDMLLTDLSYSDRAVYFNGLIKKYFPNANALLDLGCGTGSLSLEFANLGYDVIGVDISPQMLSIAKNKAVDTENVMFLCQDMTELDLYGTVDVAISALDTLNHLQGERELSQVFSHLSNFITDNGLLIFDMNTVYKHNEILADNTFVYENDEVYCVWQNTNLGNNSVDISLDFFEHSDGVYHRSSENFTECAYATDTIKQLLSENNFSLVAVFDEDSEKPSHEQSERLVYVAKRNKRNNA